MKKFDFEGLFILDMANNHQGDIEHGLNIIKAIGKSLKGMGVRGALKFQFRELDTFIHPEYRKRKDIKHVSRFLQTRLEKKNFARLTDEVRAQGLITIATPFDERSVQTILDLGIELIKIASCSAMDWPLIEKIAEVNRPVIASTAGLSLSQIDRLVSFFEYKRVHFALMHCVALYPTPHEQLDLNQIAVLKARYPDVPIGFSTHEHPDNYTAIAIAYSKGARIFERHVGLNTRKYKLNAYSSIPQQIKKWVSVYIDTVKACGGEEHSPASPEEISSLRSLMRGVYARKTIKKAKPLSLNDVFFSMPLLESQMTSGEWYDGVVADRDYRQGEPLSNVMANLVTPASEIIYRIMLQVKGMLNNARIFIGENSAVEISHHYGLERFREFGCVIVDCINRAYCKKLIIALPRQKHPYHYHKKKEESFQLLHGDLEIVLNGKITRLNAGDIFLIQPYQWHKFRTLDGAIIEEVSTTHFNDDSFYEDDKISRLAREKRKTKIDNWEAAISDSL